MKKKFGLLGRNISYSFSQKYFTEKFKQLGITDSLYEIFDFDDLIKINSLFNLKNLIGFNVTIPYKKEIIHYLDFLSEEAQEIGAVNCVHLIENKKIGYNTDTIGFKKSLMPLLKNHHKKSVILGDGGASKAVCHVLKQLGIEFLIVSRKGKFTFNDLKKKHFEEYLLWIQTTSIGTFPQVNDILNIPTFFFNSRHLVYDLIYNPTETQLLKKAKNNGAVIKNGLEMLYAQADEAWKIWNT